MQDVTRKGDFPDIHFDLLGFQFRACKAVWTVKGKCVYVHSFPPAASWHGSPPGYFGGGLELKLAIL